MIKGIPSHLQLSDKQMDEEEVKRGYPSLRLMRVVSEEQFIVGLEAIGQNMGFLINYNDESNFYRIMPFKTDVQGMIQFSYQVGCNMEKFVWSKAK